MDVEAYDQRLRTAGLRVTAPRLATLAVVEEHQHADADTVATAVRQRLGSVSKQAVYDVLAALTEAGLLRRVMFDDRRARFETDRHDNHHHFVCRSCGRIEDAPCAVGAGPCLEPPTGEHGSDPGFTVELADVVYRGLCPRCRPGGAGAARPTEGETHDRPDLRPHPAVHHGGGSSPRV